MANWGFNLENHCYASMFYHLTWSTKNREPYIYKSFRNNLYNYIANIIKNKNMHLLAIGGIHDHIHLLIQKTAKYTICDIVCIVKSNSSKFIRDNYLSEFEWQGGYSVFTVDIISLNRLKDYIEKQEVHHKEMSCDEEFLRMLKRNKMKYGEKYY